MDIHPPEGPAHSLRDFAVHIAIVTVGILIALSLEGIREAYREHSLVAETRENFRSEAEGNHRNILLEMENTRQLGQEIDAILKDLPQLRSHPEQLAPRVAGLGPSFYFFSSARWESALSTGALGFMKPAEVERYAGENILVHTYLGIEGEALPIYLQLQAYFAAHQVLSPAEVDTGIEKLIVFRSYVRTMSHVGEQLNSNIDEALRKP